MSIGLGHLRMAPATFWASTLPEFFAAMDGYLESKGVARKGSPHGAPTRDEMDELFAIPMKEIGHG